MEPKARRQVVLLATLLCVLVAVLWWNIGASVEPPAPASRRAAARPSRQQRTDQVPVQAVRLEALAQPRPEPATATRDPFRFRQAPQPAPAGSGRAASHSADGEGIVPVEPPPVVGPPPIPLRFIGVVKTNEGNRLLAILSDGTGIYRGGDGDIIEGRYRIVRVGLESVELAYVDGRGQQLIRLSGS